MAAANRKRQKHKLILTSPSGKNFPYPIKNTGFFQALMIINKDPYFHAKCGFWGCLLIMIFCWIFTASGSLLAKGSWMGICCSVLCE
jgi:hypothetical protein